MLPSNFVRGEDKSNLVYFYYCQRFETNDRLKISTNFFRSIKLAGFISLIKLLYVINLRGLILLTLYFMKYKLA